MLFVLFRSKMRPQSWQVTVLAPLVWFSIVVLSSISLEQCLQT